MQIKSSKEFKRFNYLISETNMAYREVSKKLGVADSVMQVLYTICVNGEYCTIQDICKLSGLYKQTINSALRKLEKEGMIKLSVKSAKNKTVMLTEKGKDLSKNTAMKIIAAENTIFDEWSNEDVEKYIDLTEKFLVSFRKKTEDL